MRGLNQSTLKRKQLEVQRLKFVQNIRKPSQLNKYVGERNFQHCQCNLSFIRSFKLTCQRIRYQQGKHINRFEQKIKNCFNLLNTKSDYKEDLKQIGIYRESSLKYHKNDSCLFCISENMECYSLRCEHKFCKDCWDQMIDIQLSNFIPIVKCLEYRCFERLPHLYYKEILFKRMLDNDRNFTWCPVGQSFVQIVRRIIIIPQLAIFIMKSRGLKKQINLGYHQIPAYPNCKRYIQKIKSCMQISCVCGNDFCVKCSLPWNPDNGQDFYNCPFTAHNNKNPSQIMNQMCLNESAIYQINYQVFLRKSEG
ncbi:unnamed protein product [Paramecium octaurelia]|uniref:RING-type domain-containing protein n=1 Tax=Paramecium octaurelia TaxID=43137 RepID=A0A8S1V622_PAROT|nr:unnamed protein product [Paramecium octaurelia]